MIRFIIRRLLGAAVVVWIVSVVTFAIFQLAPTLTHQSPIYYYIAKQPPPQGSVEFKELEHAFGSTAPCSSSTGTGCRTSSTRTRSPTARVRRHRAPYRAWATRSSCTPR
jgi:hypothetical protein